MGEPSIAAQVRELQQMTLAQLRDRWREVFGQETKQRHRTYLWQRLAGELQSRHFGGPSPTTEAPLAAPPPAGLSRSRKANQGAPAAPRARQGGLRDPRSPPAWSGAHAALQGPRHRRPGAR